MWVRQGRVDRGYTGLHRARQGRVDYALAPGVRVRVQCRRRPRSAAAIRSGRSRGDPGHDPQWQKSRRSAAAIRSGDPQRRSAAAEVEAIRSGMTRHLPRRIATCPIGRRPSAIGPYRGEPTCQVYRGEPARSPAMPARSIEESLPARSPAISQNRRDT